MQVQLNVKNCVILLIALFFLYLVYLLYFGDSSRTAFPLHFAVDLKDLMSYCILAAEIGGAAVVKIHAEKSALWKKSKSTNEFGNADLFTKADVISQQLILDVLNRAPGLKIISEEKSNFVDKDVLEKYKENNYELYTKNRQLFNEIPRSGERRYLLSDTVVWVDPLDATQEFTEDLLEYVTVMLCVTVRGRAKFGVIHRPFQNQTVWGLVGHGIFPPTVVHQSRDNLGNSANQKTVIISRSHAGQVENLLLKNANFVSRTGKVPAEQQNSDGNNQGRIRVEKAGGSGYKALRLLNGTVDLYVHATKIKRWDTCAADAIIRAAGGQVTDLDGTALNYPSSAAGDKNPHALQRGFFASLQDHFYYLSKFSNLLSTDSS